MLAKAAKKIGGLASIKVGRPLKMDEKRQERVKAERERDQRAMVTADERQTCNVVWMLLAVSATDPGETILLPGPGTE